MDGTYVQPQELSSDGEEECPGLVSASESDDGDTDDEGWPPPPPELTSDPPPPEHVANSRSLPAPPPPPPSTDGEGAALPSPLANAPAAAPVDPAAIGQTPDAVQAASMEGVAGVTYVSAADVDPPAGEEQVKQMLGHHLFPLVQRVEPQLAGKITGMLLELDYDEVLLLIESPEALNPRIVEAVSVLQMQQMKV